MSANPVSPLVKLLESYHTVSYGSVQYYDTNKLANLGIIYANRQRFCTDNAQQVTAFNFKNEYNSGQLTRIRQEAQRCLQTVQTEKERYQSSSSSAIDKLTDELNAARGLEGLHSISKSDVSALREYQKVKLADLQKKESYVQAFLDHKDLQVELPAKTPFLEQTLVKINDTAIKVFHAAVVATCVVAAAVLYPYIF